MLSSKMREDAARLSLLRESESDARIVRIKEHFSPDDGQSALTFTNFHVNRSQDSKRKPIVNRRTVNEMATFTLSRVRLRGIYR